MPLLDARRLNRHMSEPSWNATQWRTAEEIVRSTVNDLAGALYGAVIEPVERQESAPYSEGGRVLTRLPVAELIAVDGVVATGGVPPAGYRLEGRELHRSVPGGIVTVPVSAGLSGGMSPMAPRAPYAGAVTVHYMGGWGAEPALIGAILAKAASRMDGRHSNAVGITNLNARDAVKRAPYEFTPEELAPLGAYRNLGLGLL